MTSPTITTQVVTGPTQVTFGPGYLESVTLHRRGVRLGGRPVIQVRITGTVRVYCGEGWEHQASVRTRYQPQADFARSDAGTGQDRDYALAHDLVEVALSDWTDPCSPDW